MEVATDLPNFELHVCVKRKNWRLMTRFWMILITRKKSIGYIYQKI